MGNQKNKNYNSSVNFLRLAFEQAKINLGKTNSNPSVGCILVKNNSVISSGFTASGGRPHAEYMALKQKKNFKNSILYVTMEPCTHHGQTPPCTNLIKKRGVKKVFYTFNDIDKRTAKKSKKILLKKKIKIKKINLNNFKDFYTSYYNLHKNIPPLIDAKIAISNDFYTIRKNTKWITNTLSRKRAHLIRSQYNCIISTSKSINRDNSLLNCRIKGLDNNKPDLIIIDLNLKLKSNLKLFKLKLKRNIFLVTKLQNKRKINFFKKRGVKLIHIRSLDKKSDFKHLFMKLKSKNYNRILIESGLTFLKSIINYKLLNNLFIFKSNKNLGSLGKNNISNSFLKKLNYEKKINVNLNEDKLFKFKLNV